MVWGTQEVTFNRFAGSATQEMQREGLVRSTVSGGGGGGQIHQRPVCVWCVREKDRESHKNAITCTTKDCVLLTLCFFLNKCHRM